MKYSLLGFNDYWISLAQAPLYIVADSSPLVILILFFRAASVIWLCKDNNVEYH